jgi:hypothetical protein
LKSTTTVPVIDGSLAQNLEVHPELYPGCPDQYQGAWAQPAGALALRQPQPLGIDDGRAIASGSQQRLGQDHQRQDEAKRNAQRHLGSTGGVGIELRRATLGQSLAVSAFPRYVPV